MSDEAEVVPAEQVQNEEVTEQVAADEENPEMEENEQKEIESQKDDNVDETSEQPMTMKDYSNDECMNAIILHIADSIEFFQKERDWKQEHYVWLEDFLHDSSKSAIFFNFNLQDNTLKVSNVTPPQFYHADYQNPSDYQVAYFMKREYDGQPITTLDRFNKYIICKNLWGDPLEDLLKKMNEEYLKKLLNDNDWPDGVKLEFFANVHRFMAFLNETTYLARGQTYLYIPEEDLSLMDAVIKDKDLLQRLETTVIQWTRQIKELVSNQDSPTNNNIESPLDEIEYWTKRTENLHVLTQRLQHKDLKKIIAVLEHASSSYLPGFKELERKILKGQEEAKDNMTFLQTLYEPCKKIQQSRPSEIPKLLHDVMNSVRIIWELSRYFSTPERMKGLLSKISNQIIKRCRAKINKEDMLDGDVEQCMADLQESIDCCKQWKIICINSQQQIKKHSSRKDWTLDGDETIFAENEAFIQRCNDLMDICAGQLQFALKGAKQVMPEFGGVKGKEYITSLDNLKEKFVQYLQKIRYLKYDILDVKQTKWHEDYGQQFKEQVKNLEIMWHHIIALAFKNVATVQDAVEMLENFESLAKRQLVKDYVHKKAAEMVYKIFKDEIKEVEETYEQNQKRAPPMPYSHPKWGGLAIWAQSLIVRIDRARKAIDNLYFIPESAISKDAIEKYEKLRSQLDGFIVNTCYGSWKGETEKFVPEVIDSKLDNAILIKQEDVVRQEFPPAISANPLFKSNKTGLLESNFDSELHKLLIEVHYWTKIQTLGYITIPHGVQKLSGKRDQLRILRENVMLIVRDYNNIQHTIQANERELFKEHLRGLEMTIKPGLSRLNWNSNADSFVYGTRSQCNHVFIQVKTFQNSAQEIQNELDKITSTTITNIQKKLYLLTEFIRQQEDTLKVKEKDFVLAFERIIIRLMETYDIFIKYDKETQKEWLKFVSKLDGDLERALKQSVKNTLLDLGKYIIGDKQRQDLVPIFKVYSLIDIVTQNWYIYNEPSHSVLKTSIQAFMQKILTTTRVIPRIEKIFREKRSVVIDDYKRILDAADKAGSNISAALQQSGLRSDINYQNLSEEEKENIWKKNWELPRPLEEKHEYEERILRNKKINQKILEIIQGIEAIEIPMNQDCQIWSNHEVVSNLKIMNTDRAKQRILKGRVGEPDQDPIMRYMKTDDDLLELMAQIQNHQAQKQEHFIVLDCSKLKNKLQEIGIDFQNNMYEHLLKEAKNELYSLIGEFRSTIKELRQPPEDYYKLKQNRDLYAEIQYKLPEYEARKEPIKKKFTFIKNTENDAVLADFTQEDAETLASLEDEWKKFNDGLEEASSILSKATNTLRQSVETNLDEFKRECDDNKKNFMAQAPYNVDKNTDNQTAFTKLAEFKGICIDLRAQEEANQFGLELFSFEAVNYTQLAFVETQIQQLQEIWDIKNEWDKQWQEWKDIKFYDLNLNDLDFEALNFEDQIKNLSKEVRDWGVFNHIRSEVQKFRVTIPLLIDLRHPSMRERHWTELRLKITNSGKEDFDENSEEFNLEQIFRLNLLEQQDTIIDLADRAQRQLKIEDGLKLIRYTWEESPKTNLELERTTSKAGADDVFYTIRTTENIMELIEEHGLLLGNMKSSPFYKEFDTEIDKWETNIGLVTETLEMLSSVQQKWKYLESIFLGQQELQKQMGNEHATFMGNHQALKTEMERINKDRNALRALTVKGFLSHLGILNHKFEDIQKKLSQFLKTKRAQFPRFYFLSNEDLLEIIGQAKDPRAIQHHIAKMFEGIHSLEIGESSVGRGNKAYDIIGINSVPAEKIEFSKIVNVDAQCEIWLEKLVESMKNELKKIFKKFYDENIGTQKKAVEKDKLRLIRANLGQVLITGSQMQWTMEVNSSLKAVELGTNPQALKKSKANYRKRVDAYVELIEKSQNMDKTTRIRIVSLIIIDEHNREIIERLYQQKITTTKHFEWQQQLRFRRQEIEDQENLYIQVDQTGCSFNYGYEYQGNNGRLVVTPLTDRAYMTLTNALNMQRGGAPQGPAGTGKTETVKDLGKNLALFVVIQNCSDQMDVASLSRIFEGLSRSGAWGCFDEFNRIQVEVLSVVAQKVQIILEAIRKKEKDTSFGDERFHIMEETGLFITMNPGYAGRSELPDNLAALFRPVAMMAPDINAIAKITLMSEGFKQNETLAKKVVTIFDLMKRQLSKQDHYDFSMRAVKSVLSASGRIKRESREPDEMVVLIKAIRDMNLPKFIAEDVVLFDNLFEDLFGDMDEPQNNTEELQIAIEESLIRKNLQLNENLVVKIMQLYESGVTRHGNMLVGHTMAGKTKCWEILIDALNQLNDEEKKNKGKTEQYQYQAIKYEIINPKAVSIDELFGYLDESGPQWVDGVLAAVLKRQCQDKVDQRWMILDGPVDTLWIETLNSVLDDSKLLTLNNGDRIALTPNIRLLFEVQDLAVASPATVSRAGMIYLDIEELGWQPHVTMWIQKKKEMGEDYQSYMKELVEKYLNKVLKVKKIHCSELVKTSETACVINMTLLFDALAGKLKKADDEDFEAFKGQLERWFVFSLIWSVGATVEEQSRREIDLILRDIDTLFPHANTVYEYYINTEKKDFAPWDEKLQANWRPQPNTEFHKISVPTVDTVRNRFIVNALMDHGSQVLLVGHSGVGKTVLVEGILRTQKENTMHFTINFSAGTSSENTQAIIESYFERRAKNKYRPKNAKQKAICFIDDLNMPRKDTFGSQPPLELMRQWIDHDFWYDRAKIMPNYIQDLQFLSAMGKPGGGRAEISPRILSKFHLINYTIPTQSNMRKIFETIGIYKFQAFDDEIKSLAPDLAIATINIFDIIQQYFLPTPAKSHYVFNMRDVSKVFQGLDQADKNFVEGKEYMVKLWAHETLRVFGDRLNSYEDRDKFKGYMNDQITNIFQLSYAENCTTKGIDAIFVDFMNENLPVYDDVHDFDRLREFLNDKLAQHNNTPRLTPMNLVLFKDAISHVCRIYRILSIKRGHAFLVGVGGSGRHSLTKLAAYICIMNVFQIEVSRGYGQKHFREFLKEMYCVAAYRGRGGKDKLKSVFIFSDNDVVQESFLEDIQNMLNSGIVPNIFTNDELTKCRDEFKRQYQKVASGPENPDAMNEWFFDQIRNNLHLCICMSPIGQAFRDYCRMYPALINNTTIDWFMGWPDDALFEVAQNFIQKMNLGKQYEIPLSELAALAHRSTTEQSDLMFKQLKRIFYVTPTNYIELLKGFSQIIQEKRKQVDNQRTKLRNGLSKLDDAKLQVEKMSAASEIKRAEVSIKTKNAEETMLIVAKKQKAADEETQEIQATTVKVDKEKEETLQLAAEAEAELKKAEPALLNAEAAISQLDKQYIAEVKSFTSPPPAVGLVMSAVMIVFQKDPSWATAKKELADSSFIKKVTEFEKDSINAATLKKIEGFTKRDDFDVATITGISRAAGALCLWVRSLEDYSKALKIVAPKRQRKAYAEEQLKKKMEILETLKAKFEKTAAEVAYYEELLRKTQEEVAIYQAELDDLKAKMERGDKLITGLSGEKARWETSLVSLDAEFDTLIGDSILASAFMSYCGPFPSEFRDELISIWMLKVQTSEIPHTLKFDFSSFMATDAKKREWQEKGLATDKFSTENGVFVSQGLRWALNIDPQSQAMNWIKQMEREQLIIADCKSDKYLKEIEKAIIHGYKVLMVDVSEVLDPVLDNVLNKAVTQNGRSLSIKFGDNEIEYNKNFKLYITTRMSNPHYTPEVSCKVTCVNFSVKESGLEDQCLGIVVQSEVPSLEANKNTEIQKISKAKATIKELEDKILQLLQESKVNLLEDVTLIDTLNASKLTADEVKQSLETSEITMKRIEDTRNLFRACGRQAAILFFVLNDMNKIDPMYQFSLDWYKSVFSKSIEESKVDLQQDRQGVINKYHAKHVYKLACRSLFERHKLLLSMQMLIKLQLDQKIINPDEWNFFLKGGQILDRVGMPEKPKQDWITQQTWDNLYCLERELPEVFTGITNALALNHKEWQRWYLSVKPHPPEQAQLPGEWETKCEDRLKKMIVLRCFRTDRVNFAIRNYVESYWKKEFVESRPTILKDIFEEIKGPKEPIIFVLSPGVDPTSSLQKLAEEKGLKLDSISMGKGQEQKAKSILEEAAQYGNWVFLANCHLSISLLPELETLIDQIYKAYVNENFRIILSANPHPDFSISLLQRSIKITQEPPRGIKSNMLRLYGAKSVFTSVEADKIFRKAVFGLCWFHTILIERKKFKSLGWNVVYSFNDSDYQVCEDLIAQYTGRRQDDGKPQATYDKKEKIPWQAIQYLFADANYGGRITDDRDRRLIKVYAMEIFNDNLISNDRWRPYGTEEMNYIYPFDEVNQKTQNPVELFTPQFFFEQISTQMDDVDLPAAYGQHINAEITSQILDASELLSSILALTPQKVAGGSESGGGGSQTKLILDLKEKVPELIDFYVLRKKLDLKYNPLHVVLSQEVQRYAILIKQLKKDLDMLEKGIAGLQVISPEGEQILNSLVLNQVPVAWSFAYFSIKPLSNWFQDLNARYDFFRIWGMKGDPFHYWIGAFTYPTGFTTSLLQRYSRKSQNPIDKLEFDFIPNQKEMNEITEHPKEGAFISRLYLEGASWSTEKMALQEPEVMELTCPMPLLLFKPIVKRTKQLPNMYSCPCYVYPVRKGTVDKDSFMLNIEIKSGDFPQDFWIKRGTAILMSLSV